jgi:hypothetical protein
VFEFFCLFVLHYELSDTIHGCVILLDNYFFLCFDLSNCGGSRFCLYLLVDTFDHFFANFVDLVLEVLGDLIQSVLILNDLFQAVTEPVDVDVVALVERDLLLSWLAPYHLIWLGLGWNRFRGRRSLLLDRLLNLWWLFFYCNFSQRFLGFVVVAFDTVDFFF